MKKTQVKTIISNKLIRLMGDWFGDRPLIQALGITIVQTNVNKFDGLLDMLTDEQGEVNVKDLIDNLGTILEQDMTIDLSTISPYLPKRVIIITKSDIKEITDELLKDVDQREKREVQGDIQRTNSEGISGHTQYR